MSTFDVVLLCGVVLVAIAILATVARQRWMLHSGGAMPLAVRRHDARWSYGVGRYNGGELRWYRAIGIGTRPTRVFRRSELTLLAHRRPTTEELKSLPENLVIVECTNGATGLVMALGESAFTGFASWLESASPGGAGGA